MRCNMGFKGPMGIPVVLNATDSLIKGPQRRENGCCYGYGWMLWKSLGKGYPGITAGLWDWFINLEDENTLRDVQKHSSPVPLPATVQSNTEQRKIRLLLLCVCAPSETGKRFYMTKLYYRLVLFGRYDFRNLRSKPIERFSDEELSTPYDSTGKNKANRHAIWHIV